jgi:3-oxoacyl-[acyl-carrier-protein] synthase-1
MQEIYLIGESMISALGSSLEIHQEKITQNSSGLQIHSLGISETELPLGLLNWALLENDFQALKLNETYSRFEKLMVLAAQQAVAKAGIDPSSPNCIFIISTTKGNIELLDPKHPLHDQSSRIHLWSSAQQISRYFNNPNEPMVISNACVSGVMALNWGAELLRMKKYETAIVIGGDIISHFVLSGFQSFKSLSAKACKPFDRERDGLSLGEASACIVFSRTQLADIALLAGASHNDANHISGPSRTAEGMYYAVKDAISYAEIDLNQIDSISAHGTATPYNDEMEAIGLQRLGLQNVPTHSLKGFWGHTLGAAGIIESAALAWSMRVNALLPTCGFKELGVSVPIEISDTISYKPIHYALKLASGFSGINSALIFKKS